MKVRKNLNILVIMVCILILRKMLPVLCIVDHVIMLRRQMHLIAVNVRGNFYERNITCNTS